MGLFKFIFKGKGEREEEEIGKEIEEEIGKEIEEEIEDVRQQKKESQKIRKVASFREYMKRIILNNEIIDSQLARILRITKCSAHLCIFELEAKIAVYVMPDKNKKTFDDFYKKNIKIKKEFAEDDIDIMNILDIMPINNLDKLKKDLGGYIKDNNESGIKNYGEGLWDELIPEDNIKKTLKAELESDNDGFKDIWIFSEKKDIDYRWEWIYWKEKDFFWGDKFHIIRIRKGCNMSECLVNKKIFILVNKKEARSDDFADLLRSKLRDAGVNDSNYTVIRSPEDLIGFLDDCIILYAVGIDKDICSDYEDTLCGFSSRGKKILIFNLYPPGPLRLNSLPATWIDWDSRFGNITDEIALTFVNYFFKVYEHLLKERTKVGHDPKVSVTEIVAKTREMMEREKNLWRLACVVNGNPNFMLTA
jgi:hypothetical protein